MQPTGLNSFQRKNRQKARGKTIRTTLIVATLLGTGYFTYQFGEQQMEARISQKANMLANVVNERDQLHKDVVDLQASALVDKNRIAELEARYANDIPDETVRNLLTILREKLAAGVSADRMTTLLSAASNPRNCRDKEVKRFVLSTPLNQGTNSWAGFGNGTVTVRGEGANTINTEKKPEAWFDPSKKVVMKFTQIGGRVSVVEGVLPLQHSIIDEALEYRFTVSPSNTTRGFVDIAAVTCDYP